jgi:hypothetical protein
MYGTFSILAVKNFGLRLLIRGIEAFWFNEQGGKAKTLISICARLICLTAFEGEGWTA